MHGGGGWSILEFLNAWGGGVNFNVIRGRGTDIFWNYPITEIKS